MLDTVVIQMFGNGQDSTCLSFLPSFVRRPCFVGSGERYIRFVCKFCYVLMDLLALVLFRVFGNMISQLGLLGFQMWRQVVVHIFE